MTSYRFAPKYNEPRVFGKVYTLPTILKCVPSTILWGAATGVALTFFADSITLLRRDVFVKLPAIGWYYDDHIDPEDTPF